MPTAPDAPAPTQVPLAVDLDGTLIRTDMMWESLVRLLRKNPLVAFFTLFALFRGRAQFKQRIAALVKVDPANLPYHDEFLGWLKAQKATGRRLILATASDINMAQPVATHVGLFDDVMASDGKTNLRNAAKRHALTERFGERGYDYAGNSHDDLGVWPDTREAVVVNAPASLARQAAATTKVGQTFLTHTSHFKPLTRALRPHQWIKNLILLIPVLTAHQLTNQKILLQAAIAFVAFCLAASAVYLLNDLLDLDADRHHATKRNRPFASGDLPLQFGLIGAPLLLCAALGLSFYLSPQFALVTALYFVISTAYSWRLKQIALLDVLFLAGLYTLRLVAGHVATGIPWSLWLLTFSMFIFLSLALMKRYQEIQVVREQNGHELKGRGYTAHHHNSVVVLGIITGVMAVIVLGLYVNSAQVVKLYTHPKLLLLACPLLLAWICRVWVLTYRGEMHDDPTAFAFKDWASYVIGALTLAVMWFATEGDMINPPANQWFHDTVSALAYSIAHPHESTPELAPPHNDLTQFMLTQHAQMPDYLRAPMKIATLAFDTFGVRRGGKRFHHQSPEKRALQIAAWKNSNVGFQRDLIRYFESLATLALYSRTECRPPARHEPKALQPAGPEAGAPSSELRAEIVVIGSGPGGAITACLLAEAGRDVLLVEEGDHLPLSSCVPFSTDEMLQKYRNGGQTVALGNNKIAYVEGRCVGGGSEINSGLYHRAPPEILERWQKEFQVEAATEKDLVPHFESCERDVSVSMLPHAASPASLKLHDGATKLGWKSLEVPRWFRHESGGPGQRQSMTETFIPRFIKAGGRLLSRTRANRVRQNGNGWLIESSHKTTGVVRIVADHLFLCAGAVHTPALLRRSGITRNIGNSLQVHPTTKIVARFPDEVNSADMGVPVHQVKEFSPRLSFGCSISSPAYIALGLLDHPEAGRETSRNWRQSATYYTMITSEGRGSIRTLPGFRDPLVRYVLTETDRRNLGDGLRKLAQALFAAGATELFPSLTRGPILRDETGTSKIPDVLPDGLANLMTIHLFSSSPMGEAKSKCATDSFGRVHGFKNLFINDASLLCTAPGVNPQGSIMAIARRNALKFLGNSDS